MCVEHLTDGTQCYTFYITQFKNMICCCCLFVTFFISLDQHFANIKYSIWKINFCDASEDLHYLNYTLSSFLNLIISSFKERSEFQQFYYHMTLTSDKCSANAVHDLLPDESNRTLNASLRILTSSSAESL